MVYSAYSNVSSLIVQYGGTRPVGETDHGAGYVADQMWAVLVDLEDNLRSYYRGHSISYNYLGHTLQQSGAKWAMWSGKISFDSVSELNFLRGLFLTRLFYWQDFTPAAPENPVLVYWAGDFQPEFDDPTLQSGFVPFTLIGTLSGITIPAGW